MNKARRKKLEEIIDALQGQMANLEVVFTEERDAFDNLPEGIQYSERGEQMEENADNLESAYDSLDAVISDIQDALNASY